MRAIEAGRGLDMGVAIGVEHFVYTVLITFRILAARVSSAKGRLFAEICIE